MKLPAGFEFDEEKHVYSVAGVAVPGVTTILDQAGKITGKEWFTEASRERGRAVHRMVELELKGTLDDSDLDDALRPYLEHFRQWVRLTGLFVMHLEQFVTYSRFGLPDEMPMYAGRVDLVCVMFGHIYVVDFKTNNRPKWAGLQLAAYAGALRQSGVPVSMAASVVLNADGLPSMQEMNPMDDWAEWCSLLKDVG